MYNCTLCKSVSFKNVPNVNKVYKCCYNVFSTVQRFLCVENEHKISTQTQLEHGGYHYFLRIRVDFKNRACF